MIKAVSLEHEGGFYHYRVHFPKLRGLSGFDGLKKHLEMMFVNCPNEYFNSGPRSSKLKFSLPFEVKRISGHEVCGLACEGLRLNNERFKSAHSKVQVFMLERDNKTVAVEVPLWMEKNELDGYKKMFESEYPLTGHVDILRIEDGKLWVWDYKPDAFNERFASTQVYFYALMLSRRTGIPLNEIKCGYFDDEYAFVFNPEKYFSRKEAKLVEY